VENAIAVDNATHRKISGYYSSIQRFSEGKRIRDWLAGQRILDQYLFGLQTLKDLGVIK